VEGKRGVEEGERGNGERKKNRKTPMNGERDNKNKKSV
jgi:hypothetical protein